MKKIITLVTLLAGFHFARAEEAVEYVYVHPNRVTAEVDINHSGPNLSCYKVEGKALCDFPDSRLASRLTRGKMKIEEAKEANLRDKNDSRWLKIGSDGSIESIPYADIAADKEREIARRHPPLATEEELQTLRMTVKVLVTRLQELEAKCAAKENVAKDKEALASPPPSNNQPPSK